MSKISRPLQMQRKAAEGGKLFKKVEKFITTKKESRGERWKDLLGYILMYKDQNYYEACTCVYKMFHVNTVDHPVFTRWLKTKIRAAITLLQKEVQQKKNPSPPKILQLSFF